MSERELLIREIAQTPDTLVTEVLNFLLFIKSRKNQDDFQNPNSDNSDNSDIPSFLNFIDRVNSEMPAEENAQLPRDLSKNLDSYLYGSPKEE